MSTPRYGSSCRAPGLNCLTLLTWGTEDQKQRYLVPQAQGRKIAQLRADEPAAGSDVRGMQSVAVKRGDRYVLSGEKMWISLGDVADHFLVFAYSDLEKKRRRDVSGISAFMVERDFPGFSSGTLTEKWGILAGNTGFFKMDEVEVPEENLIGREGEGFKIAMFALDQGRLSVAAGATGLIRACRDASVVYARERQTFGVEIGRHQLVKEMIAQMESDYQAARLLWQRSAWMKNQGRRNTREPGSRSGSPRSPRSARRRTPCRYMKRTATRTSTRSAASTATARARSSTKAPARFTNSCRRTTCSATGRTSRPGASCPPTERRWRHDGVGRRPSRDPSRRHVPPGSSRRTVRTSRWRFSTSPSRRLSPAPARWGRETGTTPTRSPSRPCVRASTTSPLTDGS